MSQPEIMNTLESMHRYLMHKKIPYNCVSTIHRHQDLGFHLVFLSEVKHLVTEEIRTYAKTYGFTISFV